MEIQLNTGPTLSHAMTSESPKAGAAGQLVVFAAAVAGLVLAGVSVVTLIATIF